MKIDYTAYVGKTYGKLTTLKYMGINSKKDHIFECLCECGNIATIRLDSIRSGLTTSCGCVRSNNARKRITDKNKRNRKYRSALPGDITGYLLIKETDIKINNVFYHLCDCLKCENNDIYKNKSDIECGRYLTCGCGIAQTSKWQNEIFDFITKDLNLQAELNNRHLISPYHIDIYVPSQSIGIECNGLRYHSRMWLESHNSDGINYHKNKLNLCNNKNIRLLNIFEDEWFYNIDLVKAKIKNALHCNTGLKKSRPEKCDIREVKFNEIENFMKVNHIQGSCAAKIHIGAFLDGKLVSIISFDDKGDHAKSKIKKGSWNLKRIASDINYNIPGLIGKMLSTFISGAWLTDVDKQLFVCSSIYTFADLRWSDGDLYTKIGFTKTKTLRPDYYYVKGMQRKNKSLFIVKAGLNEYDEAIRQGWDRIYDCGKVKYEMKI